MQRHAALLAALTCVGLAGAAAMVTRPDDDAAAQTPVPQGGIALKRCDLPGIAGPARCGELQVPENPDRPDGRRLSIAIAVLPATGGKALADPIVPLMGGPGEDAISAAAVLADRLASLRSDRDILLVDQRGTGNHLQRGCAVRP